MGLFQMIADNIYKGDCLQLIKEIPDGTIDLIATDPPYRITARGGTGTMSGYMTTAISKSGRIFTHNDIDVADYIPDFYRVLKEGSHCYVMCNTLNLPRFFEVITKSEFHYCKLLVWDKQNKICGTHYMSQVEYIFFLRKGADKPINDCSTSDLLSFANKKDKDGKGNNIHDCQKPLGLMRTLIRQSSNVGDIVLDPFLGSGSTAVAAIMEKRHYIGFELDPTYYAAAERRIKEEKNKNLLF